MSRAGAISFFLGRKSLLLANLALLALIGWGFTGEYLRNQDMEWEISRLSAQAEQLETRNFEVARLSRQLADPQAMEREARVNLGLQKPGESVIIVQDAPLPTPPDSTGAARPDSRPRLSNAVRWWRYFFERQSR